MQKCDITGKGKQYGHNVSFSLRRTKKVWKPNLQTKTVIVDGKKVKLKSQRKCNQNPQEKGPDYFCFLGKLFYLASKIIILVTSLRFNSFGFSFRLSNVSFGSIDKSFKASLRLA